MLHGYIGRLLNVDLTHGKLEQETLDENICRNYLRTHGIGVKMLFDRQRAGIAPLAADSILGFVTGPLTGSPALFSARYEVVAKSPLTMAWAESNSGGDFGPYLKFAGYDAVFVSGIADKPVYLLIDNGKAELRPAAHLWGKDCTEVEDIIQAEFGKDTRVASIGPAGEKLCLISGIINDKARAAARTGVGALMGSKKLKAIAVRGQQKVSLADESKVRELRKKYLGTFSGPRFERRKKYGTCIATEGNIISGDAPVKNWGGSWPVDFPNPKSIGGEAIIEYQQRKYGCWRCPTACGGLMKEGVRYKYHAGAHKPEYETLAAFGSLCLNEDAESIVMANDICSRYGVDTISAGATIAFAIECYENQIISKADTDGIELTWGNAPAIIEMTEKLCKREGFGDILADGVQRAAERIGRGAVTYAIHVHGQEVPMHDPRKTPGWGTSYASDASPGRHTPGNEDNVFRVPDIGVPEFDYQVYSDRGRAHMFGSNWFHIINASGTCLLGCMSMPASALADFLCAVTGMQLDMDDLLEIGDRISNLRQAFTIREGLTPVSFDVPARILGMPSSESGPLKDVTVDIHTMVREYYEARDWDISTGKPSRRKLEELGLSDVARAIGV